MSYLSDFINTTATRIINQTPVGKYKTEITAPIICRGQITNGSPIFVDQKEQVAKDIILSTDAAAVDSSIMSKDVYADKIYANSIEGRAGALNLSATTANKLSTARSIALTGNATGVTTFDGSANSSIEVTVNYATAAGTAKYADYAEYYFAKNGKQIPVGTVLEVTPEEGKYELQECTIDCSYTVIGVVSEKPGFIINAKDQDDPDAVAVAVNGKTPIRVVGSIKKGDCLVSAGNGLARKATREELPARFAICLESNSNINEKLVYCAVKR